MSIFTPVLCVFALGSKSASGDEFLGRMGVLAIFDVRTDLVLLIVPAEFDLFQREKVSLLFQHLGSSGLLPVFGFLSDDLFALEQVTPGQRLFPCLLLCRDFGIFVKIGSSAVALSLPSQDSCVPRIFATERGKVHEVHRRLFLVERRGFENGSAEVDLFDHQSCLELLLGHLGFYPLPAAQHAFGQG